MGIVDEDIARVRAATDLPALVGEHVALRRQGTNFVGLCPFHNEKSPSFSVSADQGFFYCFGCGAKGDAITFVREVEHLDFVEAVEKLAARAGTTLRYDDDTGGRDRQRRTRIQETLDAALRWYHERLLTSPDAAQARAYLRRERGYDGDVVRRYQLGWAPDGWNNLVRQLGIPASALVDAGLATVDERNRHVDFFRARLLFPIFEAGGRPVGAGGRMLPGGRPPKYKNTANTAVYDKSRTLYGLNWAKKAVVEKGQVVVCEGYTDVIGLHLAGVEEAVATCGTALADGHIKLLTNFARRIVLAYDGDAAGQAAADRFYEWEKRFSVEIRVIDLPSGADPADLARTDPEALRDAVGRSRPYLGFRLERLFARADLSDPEGRARAAQEALSMVAEHPDPLVQDQYLMGISDRCRVDADRLRQMLAAGVAPPTSVGRAGPAERRPTNADPERRAGSDRRPGPVLGGPELEALRLCVHQPEAVAGRLSADLFTHTVGRRAYELMSSAGDLHRAVEQADPQVADLLQRLAVEETTADPDDVVLLLVDRAAQAALVEVGAELRQAAAEDQPAYARLASWVAQAIQQLRLDDPAERQAAAEAERSLIAWLGSRSRADPA